MNPKIKQRIEQIRRGEVPEGYSQSKYGIYPINWDVKKLGHYIKEYKELSNDIQTFPVYSSTRKGLMRQSEYYDKKEASETNMGYRIVPCNYVTYRHMSDDDIFHFNINNTGSKILVSSEYPVFDLTNEAALGFLIPILNYSVHFRYFCRTQKQGGTRTRLYFKNLSQYHIPFPPLPEQHKIADILSTQDKVIELKEQLLAQKQQQKKYLMQQLLTGKKRLPGFNGEWRKEQVRNLCTVVKGEQLNKDILDEIGLYYVLNGGMTPSGYTNKWNIMENTISISEGGNSCGYVNFNREKFWSGGHCYTLQFVKTSEIMNLFLYFYLKFCENKLQCLRVGSGLPNIQKSSLENFNVTYPTLEEQTAIVDVLSSADREIDLLRQSIEAEKQKKKALMQLLLTGIVRVTV